MGEVNPRRIDATGEPDDRVLRTSGGYAAWGAPISGTPSGAAGGVLSGSYPNPGFAVDMATQAELDAVTGALAETIRDVIGATLVAGSNVTIDVDDPGNTITITSTGGAGGSTDPEIVRDTVAAALVAGSGISIAHNDAADTITITNTGGAGGLDAEAVRDVIAAALVAGEGTFIAYDDALDTITISAPGGGGGGAGGTPLGAKVYRTTPLPLAADTPVNLAWEAQEFDDTEAFWAIGQPSRVTITKNGRYLLYATVQTVADGTVPAGTRVQAGIRRNGAVTPLRGALGEASNESPAHSASIVLATVIDAVDGDYLEVNVVAEDDVTVAAGGDGVATTFSVQELTGSGVLDPETVRDIIGATLVAGAGIQVAVDDAGNTVTITNTAGVDAEAVRDIIGATVVAGSGIAVDVDDAADTVRISVLGGGTPLTTKGDLLTIATSGEQARQPVSGVNGRVLTEDSTQPNGMRWADGAIAMYKAATWHVAVANDLILTLAAPPIAKTLQVYKNGLLLRPGSGNDYVLNGSVVTFEAPLDAGEVISNHYWTNTPNPGDSTLTGAPPATYVGSMIHIDYGYQFSFTLPSGVQANDLMVVAWHVWHGRSVDTANGWMSWYEPNGNNVVCAKFITTETAGQVVTPNPGVAQGYRAAAVMQIARGVHLTNPLYAIAVNGAALVTAATARRILHFGAQGTGGADPAPLSRGVQSNAAFDGLLGAVASDEAPAAGSYSMTPNAGFGASVALRQP